MIRIQWNLRHMEYEIVELNCIVKTFVWPLGMCPHHQDQNLEYNNI